jgi:hypothetical protein
MGREARLGRAFPHRACAVAGSPIVLPYAEEVAWTWGRLTDAAERRGRPRPVNDTWIAACCIAARLPLATFKLKDFADLAQFDGLALVLD